MYKLPPELLLNFFESEFTIKKTSDPKEIRINSIFEKDSKYHCYINLDKGVYCDYKVSGEDIGSGSVLKVMKEYLNVDSTRGVLEYIIINYGSAKQRKVLEEKPKSNVIETFLKEDKPQRIGGNTGAYCNIVRGYLEKRKISERYIDKMMYVLNDDSRYDKRVIIPYFCKFSKLEIYFRFCCILRFFIFSIFFINIKVFIHNRPYNICCICSFFSMFNYCNNSNLWIIIWSKSNKYTVILFTSNL